MLLDKFKDKGKGGCTKPTHRTAKNNPAKIVQRLAPVGYLISASVEVCVIGFKFNSVSGFRGLSETVPVVPGRVPSWF